MLIKIHYKASLASLHLGLYLLLAAHKRGNATSYFKISKCTIQKKNVKKTPKLNVNSLTIFWKIFENFSPLLMDYFLLCSLFCGAMGVNQIFWQVRM